MRRPELCQLVDPITHALLPLTLLQPTPVLAEALHYFVNAASSA